MGGTGGAGVTPVPEKVMVFSPVPSLPVMSQPADCAPAAVGANRTVPVTELPAGMVVPSAIVVVAVKAAPAGGFDFVKVERRAAVVRDREAERLRPADGDVP